MFNQHHRRIGYACKTISPDTTLSKQQAQEFHTRLNTRSTTLAWMNRQTQQVAYEKLESIVHHNITSLKNLINFVGELPHAQRIVRIGSDVLPFYSHHSGVDFYREAHRNSWIVDGFRDCGEIARELDVRLSFHPGQFLVLASHRPDVVDRSILEFEYHADMARWMGYGVDFQDFKINIHVSGQLGPAGIQAVLPRLSQVARNCITIENDEMTWGLAASLELKNDLALVVDIHHHWVKTGEYLSPTDDRFKQVIDSWRGVRPVIHFSVSRSLEQNSAPTDQLPDLTKLLEEGHKKQKLRAHSDYFWNQAVNDWALGFLEYADIMCESKMKNLASQLLVDQLNSNI